MASDVRITRTLPQRTGGDDVGELDHWTLEQRPAGAPETVDWTDLGNQPADTLETTLPTVPGGSWSYRSKWVLTDGEESPYAQTSVTVPIGELTAGDVTAEVL